jgi:hypothetical protein
LSARGRQPRRRRKSNRPSLTAPSMRSGESERFELLKPAAARPRILQNRWKIRGCAVF